MDSTRIKMVYVITERSGKSYWNRIGIAFVNQDGSINVKLDAMPVKGELQIRDYVPREDDAEAPRVRGNGQRHLRHEPAAEL